MMMMMMIINSFTICKGKLRPSASVKTLRVLILSLKRSVQCIEILVPVQLVLINSLNFDFAALYEFFFPLYKKMFGLM
jgi:hypothetical protein